VSAPIQTPFAAVPCWVIERVTDPVALRVYTYIAWRYANAKRHAFPSEERLAKDLSCSRSTIQRALRKLRVADALIVVRPRKADGHYGGNLYRLPLDDPRDTFANLSPNPSDNSSTVEAEHATQASPETHGLDVQEQPIFAGQHQASPETHDHASDLTHQEPDLLKQPNPKEEPDPRSHFGLRAVHPETRTQVDDVASPNVTCARDDADHPPAPRAASGTPTTPTSWLTDPEQVTAHNQHDPDLSIGDYFMARELNRIEQEYGGFTTSERAQARALMDEHPPRTVVRMLREQRDA